MPSRPSCCAVTGRAAVREDRTTVSVSVVRIEPREDPLALAKLLAHVQGEAVGNPFDGAVTRENGSRTGRASIRRQERKEGVLRLTHCSTCGKMWA